MHIFPAVRAEFSFTKTIGELSRNMSDMMNEGDIPDILLSQIAEMMDSNPPTQVCSFSIA
jgi:hypothetical protein